MPVLWRVNVNNFVDSVRLLDLLFLTGASQPNCRGVRVDIGGDNGPGTVAHAKAQAG